MSIAPPRGIVSPPQSGVPLRRVLLLCVPALMLGAILRIAFLETTPEIFYGADSNSYFEAALKLWNEGQIKFNDKRRYLYPAMLVFAPLLPGSTAVGVAVIQHILGLLIIVGIAWIVAQMTRFPDIWVPLATCLAAVWPRMFWYEHEMIAEVWILAAFVTAVALAVPCGALKDKQRLFWFLVALVAIVALKPHGRGLWLGLMLVAVAMAGNPLRWGVKNLTLVGIAALVMLTTGSGQQGSWLLLNSTLPLVQIEGEPYAKYRAILQPFIEEARADLGNYAHRQTIYKKGLNGSQPMFGDEWKALTEDRALYTKVANRLAAEAILAHPLAYAQLVARKIARASIIHIPGRIAPAKFWSDQEAMNTKRIQRDPNEIELLYGIDVEAYRRLVEERRQRTTWLAPLMTRLSHVLYWVDYRPGPPGTAAHINPTVLGWLLALGLVASLSPRHFACRALLLLPVAFYLFTTFGVGDSVSRYLHPIDWAGIVLIAIGLDTLVGLVADVAARLRRRFGVVPAAAP